ncbi:hypothetical protein RBSH_04969 [Rhodopirellula baltica SH28]|uniref:Uncharacterized protein n=1 Tax=Rhodopirellula baltica SH28 TaxID=993517 RepID=K5E285_RHOBT|nr:hypothetical protein RBSH_04969 [Rhodopirellula baltica SH28]
MGSRPFLLSYLANCEGASDCDGAFGSVVGSVLEPTPWAVVDDLSTRLKAWE